MGRNPHLNLRSVVDARQGPGDCPFDRILDRFVSEEFRHDSEPCPVKLRCPVKFNVLPEVDEYNRMLDDDLPFIAAEYHRFLAQRVGHVE